MVKLNIQDLKPTKGVVNKVKTAPLRESLKQERVIKIKRKKLSKKIKLDLPIIDEFDERTENSQILLNDKVEEDIERHKDVRVALNKINNNMQNADEDFDAISEEISNERKRFFL